MGSIEVFDYKQMKWVPYLPPPDQAERYYQRLVASLDTQSHPSTVATKLKETEDKLKEAENKLKRLEEREPIVKQVTPVSQAIERAKSEILTRNRDAPQRQRRTKRSGTIGTDWRHIKY